MEKQRDISKPVVGMNRAASPINLSEQEYTFQKNGNSYDSDGEKYTLTDENSNLLASKFKSGYKYVGGKNHVVRDKTYIFLTNPETGDSEIGCIQETTDFTVLSDQEKELDCNGCKEFINIEATPLEEQTQTPHQIYVTLLEDSCNRCLNFNIDFPIIDIVIKEENVGTTLWWTSTPGNNEFRYIELDNLEQYRVTGDDNCGEVPEETCLDCDKLRVFKLYTELKTRDYERTVGGNLRRGSYEILGAYSDQVGNEMTSYTSLTPIIPIFDEANIIHEQEDNNAETNFSIKVELEEIDQVFDFYKIAVRYYTSVGVFTSFEEGIHGTSDRVIILSDNNGPSINNTAIALRRPFVETVDGLTVSNNILVLNGVRQREPVNLQPVVNLAGLAVQWMSFRAQESLYSQADSYKYVSYNRDENIAISIDFGFKSGYRSNPFIFIPRPPTEDEVSTFSEGNDFDSITDIVGDCDGNLRDKKWQFYNTATDIGVCPLNEEVETTIQTENISTYTEVAVPSVPQGQIVNLDFSFVESFSTIEEFIAQNRDEPEATSPLGTIFPFISLPNLTSFNNTPNIPFDTCNTFSLDPSSEEINVENVENGRVIFNFPPNADDYQSVRPPTNTLVFQQANNTLAVDEEFSFAYDSRLGPGDFLITRSARRQNFNYNDSCTQAETLQRITDGDLSNIFSINHFNNEGYLDLNDFLELSVTMPSNVVQGATTDDEGAFLGNLHRHALWFSTRIFERERFYINISRDTFCERGSRTYGGVVVNFNQNTSQFVRVSIFDRCNSTTPLHSEIVNIDIDNFISIDSTIISTITNDNLLISIEAPIISSTGLGPDWDSNDYVEVETESDGDRIYRFRNNPTELDTFILHPPCGAFSIVDRDEEPESATLEWDSIKLIKSQKYNTSCDFEIPVIKDCEPVPFRYGEFGYYESTEEYPDNEELYNSSNLIINKNRITSSEFLSRLDIYKENETAEQIILSENADFRCKKIRHYKFPDNKISPFIRTQAAASNSNSIISPLGFTIDGEVINNALDIAVDNGLITQQQRDNIVNYKIYRSDTTLDRSVVASGLVYNTKSYKVEEEEVNYFNYPFNSLGKDKYFPDNTDTIFDKFQAISPEFDYFSPSLPTEMSVQGFMFGKSNSRVVPVEEHSRMVILGDRARALATTLAILEVTSETVIAAAQAASNAQVWFIGGPLAAGGSVGAPAFAASAAILAIGVVEGLVSRVSRYRQEWEQAFEGLGTPYNFGYYTASGSNYNYLRTLQSDGDRLRGLSVREYLKSGMLSVSDTTSGSVTRINNIDREETPFFSLGDFPIENLDPQYTTFDNSDVSPNFSSQILSSETGCQLGKSSEQIRNIASPYVAFKNYIPNQYGTIDSIRWVDTTFCIPITETGICNGVLGGDTFISRHSKKRKARIFETDLLNEPDNTPFPYRYNANYGDPRYYIDFKINSEFQTGNRLFPNIFYDVQFDCVSGSSGFYVEPPGKFYLYGIAFSNFLCETRVNTNFRNARAEPWNQFFPQNTDYEAITQPDTVSLNRVESFFYNRAYLQTSIQNTVFGLPEYYSSEDESRRAYNVNSGIYSLPDVNENSITEPWLIYRPNDMFTLESRFGNLIGMKGIESGQILMYFEDALQLQNAVNQFTDGSTQYNAELGNGGMFGKRALTLRTTDIGYGGSQSKQTLSCEFGHFHADVKRGQVFNYVGGKDLQEISRYSNGRPNGMDTWFKEHLPIKFLKIYPDFINKDNPYNGIGVHWGYDSKYRRVILTKKDYILSEGVTMTYDVDTNLFNGETFQERVKDGSFKEISWTLTYRPEKGSWESYMSYLPNYYINHTEYFQSGMNSHDDTFGLWSHLLTNKSYRVFYGQKYPYVFEYPVKNQYFSKRIEDFKWNAQLRRYHNDYDFAPIEENPFTAVTIYNDYENSGRLIPVKNNGTLSQLSRYPITNEDNTQDVLVSYDNYRYNLDYFYNRTLSNKNNQPIWLWDENQIDKTINPKAVSFYGKSTLERLKGNFFLVRLERDGNTNFDLDFRWSEQTTNPMP